MKTRYLTGHYKNGVIVPEEKINVDDDTELLIVVSKKPKKSKIKELSLKLKSVKEEIIEKIIESTELGDIFE